MSIHTHRMSGTTSDIEPRRRQQNTHVLGRRKSYEAKSRLLMKKRYSLMIYRAFQNQCTGFVGRRIHHYLKAGRGYTRQSLSWLSIHRYRGNPLKMVTFIALKCPHFCRPNVRFYPLICPLNPLKCPSP